MRPRSDPFRRASLALMAVCALLPTLLALIAVGLGAAAPTTQGLTQATGALSAAAFQGLDRRGLDLAPLLTCPGTAGAVLLLSQPGSDHPTATPVLPAALAARLPLRI